MSEKWHWFLACACIALGIAILVIAFNTPKNFDGYWTVRLWMRIGTFSIVVGVYFIYRIFTSPDLN